MKVAVRVLIPAPKIVAVPPLSDTTDGAEEVYVNVPVVLAVGPATANEMSP